MLSFSPTFFQPLVGFLHVSHLLYLPMVHPMEWLGYPCYLLFLHCLRYSLSSSSQRAIFHHGCSLFLDCGSDTNFSMLFLFSMLVKSQGSGLWVLAVKSFFCLHIPGIYFLLCPIYFSGSLCDVTEGVHVVGLTLILTMVSALCIPLASRILRYPWLSVCMHTIPSSGNFILSVPITLLVFATMQPHLSGLNETMKVSLWIVVKSISESMFC